MADEQDRATRQANTGGKTNPDDARDAERKAGQPERPDVSTEGASLDEQLQKSPRSPNELDQSDESQNAADITRGGGKSSRSTRE